MGRYTGPSERLSRRAGVELELKGERRMARKSGLDRRAYPPGEHGRTSGRRPSVYAVQLAGKQVAKRYYGVRERQFRRYVREAQRTSAGRTGDRLLQLLELRLDNVILRLGFAATRAQARQFVSHRHADRRVLQPDLSGRQTMNGPLPFAVHATIGCPTHAELALGSGRGAAHAQHLGDRGDPRAHLV